MRGNGHPYGSKENPIAHDDIESRKRLLGSSNIVVTHDGRYHDDDLFAAAIFDIYYDGDLKIKRTRDIDSITKFQKDIQQNNPSLNYEINQRAKEMTPVSDDIEYTNKLRKRNYFNELKKEAYHPHNKQPVPFLIEDGKIIYFEADYLFDIGHGELDHHDNPETGEIYWNYRQEKPDMQYWNKDTYTKFGVKYAAAGLTWEKFGRDVIKKALSSNRKLKAFAFDDDMVEEIFKAVDEELISVIDYKDNANKGEYRFSSENYRSSVNQARKIIDYDYEDDEYYDENRTPFEIGVHNLANRYLKTEIRGVAKEIIDTRQYEAMFNEAVDNCTNQARVIEFDCNFKYSTLAKKNKKSKFINFVIMKENEGDNYLIKFNQKGEYSIAAKPLLEHWEAGYNGITHINDFYKVISVQSLEQARQLVDEFYNYYSKEMDRTNYTMDSMKAVETDIDDTINKNKDKVLTSLNQGIYKYERALEVLKRGISVSVREGKFNELFEQIKYHEAKIVELKKEHNEYSLSLGRDIKYPEVDVKESEVAIDKTIEDDGMSI